MVAAGIENAGCTKHRLDCSIFARPTMQSQEHHIRVRKIGRLHDTARLRFYDFKIMTGRRLRSDASGKKRLYFRLREHAAESFDRQHVVASFFQRLGDLNTTGNRDITFRAITTEENCYFHSWELREDKFKPSSVVKSGESTRVKW